jgi:NTP pyrophosphatase (non-canonical NTP hydrolase)
MDVDQFQEQSWATCLPSSKNIEYLLFGLCNETGEVAGKYKKVIRGDVTIEAALPGIRKELGDVAWYLAGACEIFGLKLSDVMQENRDKLNDRAQRGVLRGNGDYR